MRPGSGVARIGDRGHREFGGATDGNMHNFVNSEKLQQPSEMPVKHLGCSAYGG